MEVGNLTTAIKDMETADRDHTRMIIRSAVDVLLSTALGTPGDRPMSMERLLEEFRGAVLPALNEYRARCRRRATQKTG